MHGMRHVLEHGQTLRATSVTQIQKSRRCENTIWMELHCFMLVHGGGGGIQAEGQGSQTWSQGTRNSVYISG